MRVNMEINQHNIFIDENEIYTTIDGEAITVPTL